MTKPCPECGRINQPLIWYANKQAQLSCPCGAAGPLTKVNEKSPALAAIAAWDKWVDARTKEKEQNK